jgi:hypothetical protein
MRTLQVKKRLLLMPKGLRKEKNQSKKIIYARPESSQARQIARERGKGMRPEKWLSC